MRQSFDTFEIGDAQSGNFLSGRPFWLTVAVIASICAVIFYNNPVNFWASVIVAAAGWVMGLGGHVKIIVDSSKREIRVSNTTLWSEKPRRVVSFDDVASSEVAYSLIGEGDTYLPRLILKSGEKLALTTTGCSDRSDAEAMTRRVMRAVGKPD